LPVPPDDTSTEESGEGDDDDDDDDDEPRGGPAANGSDPYSNLDSAFGNYLADEPRPMTNGRNADDDLLF
jgi:hypothetical protein